LIAFAFSLCAWAPSIYAGTQIIHKEIRTKSFEDVVFDLEFAITQRNFRITARNDIGQGIRERGVKNFPNAIIIHFCNLTFARKALQLDPLLITYMPCRMAVYDDGGRVIVSTALLPENSSNAQINAFSRRMNDILRRIIRFAVK
jgi:uncharacterized protein (DUF302 family)